MLRIQSATTITVSINAVTKSKMPAGLNWFFGEEK
jgi:hypothetical protein